MLTELMTAGEVFEAYKDDMLKLIAYLPWLEEKSGKSSVSGTYEGEGLSEHSMSFPVYDGTLLRFIKAAESTKFMDRNYPYVFTRNRLRTYKDERDFVARQTIRQIDSIGGVLSKYVMGGRSKSKLWSDAVDQGIFLAIAQRLKELYDLGLNGTSEQ